MLFPIPQFSHDWKSNRCVFVSGDISSNEYCANCTKSNCETSIRPADARTFHGGETKVMK
jgi:hypothetical protein